MTRYLMIWNPGFEAGRSRQETVDSLHEGWRARAPWLIERRKIELASTSNSEVRRLCDEWMECHWGHHIRHDIKSLSVVAVSDPAWEKDGEKHLKSVQAMRAGYESEDGAKPKAFVFAVEADCLE